MISEEDEMIFKASYMVMYANELTTNIALELIDKIKKRKINGGGIGSRVKNLKLELNRYKYRLKDTIKESSGWYADYSDARDEEMKHHIDVLYYSIHGIVINHRVDNPDILSFAELARLVSDFAVAIFINVNKFMKRERGSELQKWMRITGIFGALEQLSRTLCMNYAHEEVNVNTETVQTAASIFFKRLIGDGVMDAVYVANELNQDEI